MKAQSERVIRVAAILAAVLVLGIAGGGAANAINTPGPWNTQSNPLVARGYGSVAKAAGSAHISNGDNGTRIYNKGTHKFTDGDNHRPYLKATSEWNAGSCASASVTVNYKGVEVAGSSECARSFYDGENFGRANGVTHYRIMDVFSNQISEAEPRLGSRPCERSSLY